MATRYPPEWIEELRARADIVSIVSEYVPLKQNGRRYWGLCPFHHEKTASFSVSPDDGFYYCFGCKAGGTVIQFVMDTERMEFGEAVKYLAEKVRFPLPETRDDGESDKARSLRERIYEINRRAALFFFELLYAPEGEKVLDYLYKRGLDDPAIRMFGLGASPTGWDTLTKRLLSEGATAEELTLAGLAVEKETKRFDMFRNRAMFPILSAHGQVLGFGGRAMGDAQPKYLNTSDTPAFNKRQNVFAQNLLRKAKGLKRVLLVEGYMDVVSLAAAGVEGVAATLGTSLTPEQARLLKRYAPEVWVAYDGDEAGQKAIMKALDIFQSLDIPARVLALPDGLDPDDFIRQRGKEAFDALKPMSAPRFRMRRAAVGVDLSTEEGRMQYAIACASVLRSVRQPVELENLIKRLSIETGFSREVLLQQIGVSPVEKTAYTGPPRREKLPASAPPEASETDHAERLLLSLISAGLAPPGSVDADRFSGEGYRRIAARLLAGEKQGAMLESCEDDAMKQTMLEVFAAEPRVSGEEATQIVADCLERMRRGWIDERRRVLTESLSTAEAGDKIKVLKEIMSLDEEKRRLRPGRKE